MDVRQSIRGSVLYLTVLLLIKATVGYREYIAVLYDFRCFSYNDFFKNVSCNIDKSGVLSAYVEMQKEVDDVRLDSYGNTTIKNIAPKELFNYKGIKACDILKEPVSNPVLRVTKQMIVKYLNMPKACPVPADFVFSLSNYTFDTEYLPVILPEATFQTRTKIYGGNKLGLIIELKGRIVRKKVKTKGRQKSSKSKQTF